MYRLALLALALLPAVCNSIAAQGVVQLTDTVTHLITPATMSGDGSRIFYWRRQFSDLNPLLHGTLYLRRVDESVPEVLAENVRMDWMISDRLGLRLIFGVNYVYPPSPEAGLTQIFLVNVATRKVSRLVNHQFQLPVSGVQVALAEESDKLILTPFFGGIWEIPLQGGELKQVLPSWGQGIDALASDPRGEVFYVADSSAQNRGIWRVSRSGDRKKLVVYDDRVQGILDVFVVPDESRVFLASQSRAFRYVRMTGAVEELFPGGRTRLGSLSADGKWLLVETTSDPTGENRDGSPELFLVSADGGQVRQLTRTVGLMPVFWGLFGPSVQLSDDGSSAMLLSHARAGGSYDPNQALYRIQFPEGEFQLMDHTWETVYESPQALDGSPHVVFATMNAAAGRQFMIARTDGSHHRQLADLGATSAWRWRWSATARSLVFAHVTGDGFVALSLYRTATGQILNVAKLRLEVSNSVNFSFPDNPFGEMSVDDAGEIVVFTTSEKLRPEDPEKLGRYAYAARISGQTPEIKFLGPGSSPLISADGGLIVLSMNGIAVLRPDGSRLIDLGEGDSPDLSADGRWVLFRKNLYEFCLARTDGSLKKCLSLGNGTQGFSAVQLSGDGKVIAAVAQSLPGPSAPVLYAFDTNGRELGRIELAKPFDVIGPLDWSLDYAGAHAFFVSAARAPDNQDGSREIFAARLRPFNYWIPEVSASRDSLTGLALVNPGQTTARVTLAARAGDGVLLGDFVGLQNPKAFELGAKRQLAALVPEFLENLPDVSTRSIEITTDRETKAYFLIGLNEQMQGAVASDFSSHQWVFPLPGVFFFSAASPMSPVYSVAKLVLVNPGDEPANVSIRGENKELVLPAKATASVDVFLQFPAYSSFSSLPLLEVVSSQPLRAELRLENYSPQGNSAASVPPLEPAMASDSIILPHVVLGGGYRTVVWVANPSDQVLEVEVEFVNSMGERLLSAVRRLALPGKTSSPVFLDLPSTLNVGYVRIEVLTPGGRVAAVALVSHGDSVRSLYVADGASTLRRRVMFPHVAQTNIFFTGYSVVNPYDFPVRYQIEVFDKDGNRKGGAVSWVGARQKRSELLSQILQEDQAGGYFTIVADWPVLTTALIGTASGSALANLPPL